MSTIKKIRKFFDDIPLAFYQIVISFICGVLTNPAIKLGFHGLIEKLIPSLISFLFTLIILEKKNQVEEEEEKNEKLIKKCRSKINSMAISALEELRILGKMEAPTGILKGECFFDGNWEGANLSNADLRNSNILDVNINKANLSGANLRGAIVIESNATKEKNINSIIDKFSNCKSMRGSLLPNGKIYNGFFQLKEDLKIADASGINVDDKFEMARWYGVDVKDYLNKEYLL